MAGDINAVYVELDGLLAGITSHTLESQVSMSKHKSKSINPSVTLTTTLDG